MAVIELVIKIPEKMYESVMDGTYCGTLYQELKNGTPLTKGHGRLIDADELKRHKYHDNNRFENAVAVAQIDWADTIIEADKEQEDGNDI